LEERCPPVTERLSIKKRRISSANRGSSSTGNCFNCSGELIFSRSTRNASLSLSFPVIFHIKQGYMKLVFEKEEDLANPKDDRIGILDGKGFTQRLPSHRECRDDGDHQHIPYRPLSTHIRHQGPDHGKGGGAAD